MPIELTEVVESAGGLDVMWRTGLPEADSVVTGVTVAVRTAADEAALRVSAARLHKTCRKKSAAVPIPPELTPDMRRRISAAAGSHEAWREVWTTELRLHRTHVVRHGVDYLITLADEGRLDRAEVVALDGLRCLCRRPYPESSSRRRASPPPSTTRFTSRRPADAEGRAASQRHPPSREQ